MIRITEKTFDTIALKLQEQLADIIRTNKQVNDYELIVYKYVFISELKVPLQEDLGVEIDDDSFILYVIPDDLEFSLLKKLDETFDKFQITFMSNPYNILKLKFRLSD
ncbi:hypothetical protein [Methanobrevibacter sp.]|uniref:hypothetical protein n=1 Tax=Methanobrevibacter sp. TaxID=66852 RepID=UPI0025DC624E|nr:hypothetical protein [Methanobrevibacter sp.]MBQ6099900.1 hypothetical protein [Methanobrevibacter sp.]MBQ6513061.1 hypothetical protein [Methanobrevibacter sp.]